MRKLLIVELAGRKTPASSRGKRDPIAKAEQDSKRAVKPYGVSSRWDRISKMGPAAGVRDLVPFEDRSPLERPFMMRGMVLEANSFSAARQAAGVETWNSGTLTIMPWSKAQQVRFIFEYRSKDNAKIIRPKIIEYLKKHEYHVEKMPPSTYGYEKGYMLWVGPKEDRVMVAKDLMASHAVMHFIKAVEFSK